MGLSREEIDEIRKAVEEEIKKAINQKHNEMKAEAASMPSACEIEVEMYPVDVDGFRDFNVDKVNITLDTYWDKDQGEESKPDSE